MDPYEQKINDQRFLIETQKEVIKAANHDYNELLKVQAGYVAEAKRLREALEGKDSYIKRLIRKVARSEKRFDKLLETTEQALKETKDE